MAKGQKRSNRETRKPKQDKPKPPTAQHRSFLSALEPRHGAGASGSKAAGR